MNGYEWVELYGESGEKFLYNEGSLWLTDRNLYLGSLVGVRKIALGNIKEVKHSAMEASFSLDIVSIIDRPKQVKSLQGLKDAVKVRRLINEAIAKLPKEGKEEVVQDVVLNNVSVTVPRSELTNNQQLKSALNKAIGEEDVDWLWVHQSKPQNFHQVHMGLTVGAILMGVIIYSFLTKNYGTMIMLGGFLLFYIGSFLLPLLKETKYHMFGVTHNRIVAISHNAKKVEQIAISSIQKNKIEKEGSEAALQIETSRKKIKIPNLKFDQEVQEMIEVLKTNSDNLLFLD